MKTKHHVRHVIFAWMPAFVWMGCIFVLSGRPSLSVAPQYWVNFLFFKSLHIVEYAVLFLTYIRAIRLTGAVQPRYAEVTAFIMVIAYAATDEIHQLFVPTRTGKLRDVIIDAVGAGLAWYILRVIQHGAHRKLRHLGRNLGILS